MKSVCIRSYPATHFPHSDWIRRDTKYLECGKMRTRITPNTDTFYEVGTLVFNQEKYESHSCLWFLFPTKKGLFTICWLLCLQGFSKQIHWYIIIFAINIIFLRTFIKQGRDSLQIIFITSKVELFTKKANGF